MRCGSCAIWARRRGMKSKSTMTTTPTTPATQTNTQAQWRLTMGQAETAKVGALIKARRLELKMSRYRLSSDACVAWSVIEAAERGERLPSEAALFQIGRVLDIPISVERSIAPGSDRREKVLAAIRGYVKTHYAPPPIRWLCGKTGISSTSLMRYYILGLIREGRLVRTAQGAKTYWYTVPELIEAVKTIEWK